MQYDHTNLVVHPQPSPEPGLIVRVTPALAGWEFITFEARRLAHGETHTGATGEHELAIVVLSGVVGLDSDAGRWREIGQRMSVFEGLPYAVYLPRRTTFTVHAQTDAEIALAFAPTNQDHPARLIQPTDVTVEIRGGDNATRQINNIIPPGFDCHRLVVVEVYTPSGNWSSYPPHKHDVHKTDAQGRIVEADLEEVYFYKFDRPEGYAYQRIYTDPESPLHRAGAPIDAVVVARHNDVVLVPEGYHPVASPPGYTTYYLNTLAGSAQSLANSEDPRHAWVKTTYRDKDPRLPMYRIGSRESGVVIDDG
ncbi:MAG: 5-deoxy-glucuronate isomerase [Candidatus Roseilinea sp.]|nr:MAG: 5-deoxy-glucuronate isomerase [Candidatus Roseilinea sp.]